MNPLFASDNVTSACPEVMDAVIEANSGISGSCCSSGTYPVSIFGGAKGNW